MAYILNVKDEKGDWIGIPAINGEDGKSAYEQAKDGGYEGTEEEFIAMLNDLTNSEDAEKHYGDFNNPHNVTAQQAGAIPEIYYASNDLNNELKQGGNKITICNYHSGTLNSPYKEGATPFAHGMVITNAHSAEYGTQFCLPSGSEGLYTRALNGQGVTPWKLVALQTSVNTLASSVTTLTNALVETQGKLNNKAEIAVGSYKGTNTYGVSKPSTLTFDFVPYFVIVSRRQSTNFNSGATFIWINPGTTINFINNGSTYWVYPTLNGTTLSWYNTESASYQLNNSSYEYDYLSWGVQKPL